MKWLSDSAVSRLREAIELPDLSSTPYRLLRKVGAGGMGTIYLAEDAKLSRNVAIKVMNDAEASRELGARMLTEAKIVAKLEHPSIVPVHDVGVLPDQRVYYVMKYVEGNRLDQYVGEGKPLPELLRVFQKSCEALAFAHAHGVIHRDLKPENIMVGPFGEVLIMDWGIAKVTGDPGASAQSDLNRDSSPRSMGSDMLVTADGAIVGTPAYMSPEQAAGRTESLDQRTDVYALGAILCFLLTGRHPPAGAQDSGAGSRTDTAALLRHRSPRIPRPLQAICSRAMANDVRERYESALELASDVANFLDGLEVKAYRESLFEKGARWAQKNRFLLLLILAYLIMRAILLIGTGR